MSSNLGYCLVSQQIKALIAEGKIKAPDLDESQIQPASLDPRIGDHVYILDTEQEGLFRPHQDCTVEELLSQLSERKRKKVSIVDGFEIKKGFTYLFPLVEQVNPSSEEYIVSSTKSTFGRLFLDVRMLADYNPSFNEVHHHYKQDTALKLWLLVQPLTFNLIVYPGLNFNQIRFFRGHDAKLNAKEILKEFETNPLLVQENGNGSLDPVKPIVTDGLHIHLDVSGKHTNGVVGLRARHNPEPIDLRKKHHYDVDHFFEPIYAKNGSVSIVRGEHYLFASKEILKIPAHLSIEVSSHSTIGLHGPLHFAGFADNGFEGDLVFEVRSDELSKMVLNDGMPISKLDVFRTEKPDVLYGEGIGSHYQRQIGPKPAKYFQTPEYKKEQ